MSASPDDALVRELYRTDPEQFVVQRDATVKRLKSEGRKDEAAALAKLRRPKVAEHALNLLAASDRELVGRWAASVAAAEHAQVAAIDRGDASALSAALADVRRMSVSIIDAAVKALGVGGAAQRTAIADLVRAATNTPGAARLRAGLVGAPFEPSEEFFPGTEHVTVRATSAAPPKQARRSATRSDAVPSDANVVALRRSTKRPNAGTDTRDKAVDAPRAAESKAAALAAADEQRRREQAEAAHRAAVQRAEARIAEAAARVARSEREQHAATKELREAQQALAELARTAPRPG